MGKPHMREPVRSPSRRAPGRDTGAGLRLPSATRWQYQAWAQMAAGSGESNSAGHDERFDFSQRAKDLARLVFVSSVTSLPRSGNRTMTSSAAGDGSAAPDTAVPAGSVATFRNSSLGQAHSIDLGRSLGYLRQQAASLSASVRYAASLQQPSYLLPSR